MMDTIEEKTPRPSALERVSAMTACVAVLALLGFAAAREMGWMDPDWARRGAGASLSVLLIVVANLAPKLGGRFAGDRRAAARRDRAERRGAGILVLSGLAILAIWIWAPADRVVLASGLVGLAAFFVALALYLMSSPIPGGPLAGDPDDA